MKKNKHEYRVMIRLTKNEYNYVKQYPNKSKFFRELLIQKMEKEITKGIFKES